MDSHRIMPARLEAAPSLADVESLQDTFAPDNICFGCGPNNDKGLRIKSRVVDDDVVAEFTPEAHHQAFPGVINGGIIGTLFDCHMNWAAADHLMQAGQLDHPPATVTAEFHVKFKRPTPFGRVLRITARVIESDQRRAVVEAEMEAAGDVTATCRAVFVAVEEGHPAFHRW